MKQESDKIVHDKIGQDIKTGSIVAVPESKSNINICRVEKIANVKIKVQSVSGRAIARYKYPSETICLDEMDQTIMFLMTQNI